MAPLRFVVIGIGGYARVHLQAVEWLAGQGLARLSGVVVEEQEQKANPAVIASFRSKQVRLFRSIDHFFAEGIPIADVLTVPIGIHEHAPVSIRALRKGLHVYCEKPAAATVQEVDELIAVEQETGRIIAIGFQYLCSPTIHRIRDRLKQGRLGRVRKIRLLCGWPRSRQYYSRNEWAGRLKLKGHWVLDTPAGNAHAHYLMNMLYLATGRASSPASPISVQAELYRANHIESADLVQLKWVTDTGCECHAVLAHCNSRELGPLMTLECEYGRITCQGDEGRTEIEYGNGRKERFDNTGFPNWRWECLKDFVEAIQNNRRPVCPPELARHHTLTINAMHESCPVITTIPEEFITETFDEEMFPPGKKGDFRRVDGLDGFMQQAIEQDLFFSEMKVPWAREKPAQKFVVQDYQKFPGSEIR